jgi:hypothetical protein
VCMSVPLLLRCSCCCQPACCCGITCCLYRCGYVCKQR